MKYLLSIDQGTFLDDMAGTWKAESTFTPRMKKKDREEKLSQWNKALFQL